ncbi:MAG: TolC family protein [Oxalicibacterium faecigallinarum]|uniref:TolC family protein n=1 Tax=Oxalicibacterium faecigallinarum TaxID=573741 RepID=UPI002808A428|nr:TolC family protein [Oxalicibacterium faecigallinarum]MDQ7968926.1 TolC family protein [Oxalicibacterium faecigallinarum]
MRHTMRGVTILLAACAALPAWSQTMSGEILPQRVALDAFLQIVERNNPSLQADRLQIDAAQGDLQAASAFPNPVVSYGRKPNEKEAVVEQPIPIFGQRGLRMEGARLGVDATSARVTSAKAMSLRDAAHDFITLLVAQEKLMRREKAEKQMEQAHRIVVGQVEAGTRSRYDKARMDIEFANIRMQAAQARSALSDATARVIEAVGAPGWNPIAVGTLQPTLTQATFDSLWLHAQDNLPAVRAAIAEQALADKMIEVEKREAWPTPAFGVGKLRDSEGRHTVIGVSVEIPLFDRRQGQVAKAQAQAREASLRREAVIRNAQNELRRATALLSQRIALTQRFRNDALDLLPDLNQMAQDSYSLGKGSILELIDSIQSISEKEIVYLDLTEELLQAEIDVRFASGDMVPGTMTANSTR